MYNNNSDFIEISCPELADFPNITEKVPSARWCAENEMCWFLEDYLRRHTNIAQWISRGGFGSKNKNFNHLRNLASLFIEKEEIALKNYQQKIRREFDDILANVEF
jgi:hypothetical protein